MAADDGSHYIQKIAGCYKISDKRHKHSAAMNSDEKELTNFTGRPPYERGRNAHPF